MATAPTPGVSPQFAAAFRDISLQNLRREVEVTSKVIAAVPDERRDYRPDPKARTAWELAWHIASEDVIFLEQICELKLKFPDPRYDSQQPRTSAELAAWYRRNMERAIEQVGKLSAEKLTTAVDFFGFMTLPVVLYLPMVGNHSIHHRGQLSAYLRPMGSRVPQIYGGSADEPLEWPTSA